MKVLHLNVRLKEGGAARIALDLCEKSKEFGVQATFGYGWGERGGTSSFQSSVPGSFQVGSKHQVIGNMIVNRLVGVDIFLPNRSARDKIISTIKNSDVIHLHAVHSYYIPFEWLVDILAQAKKPIVFTAHDYWLLTGRCAFTEGCERWRLGCGACHTKLNYPPVFLDISAKIFTEKRKQISKILHLMHIVTPSYFMNKYFADSFPDTNVCNINNWIDSDLERVVRIKTLSDSSLTVSEGRRVVIVVVANDLSDSSKVDFDLVSALSKLRHVEIKTIGKNSPFSGANVRNFGSVFDRSEMFNIVSESNLALFTSVKDTFGLVMVECLACGVPVLATESYASKEVLSRLALTPLSSAQDIFNIISERRLPRCYYGKSARSISAGVLDVYSASRSVGKYVDLYKSLV